MVSQALVHPDVPTHPNASDHDLDGQTALIACLRSVDSGNVVLEAVQYGFNEYVIKGSKAAAPGPSPGSVSAATGSHTTVEKTGSPDGYIGACLTGSYELLDNTGDIHGIGQGVLLQ